MKRWHKGDRVRWLFGETPAGQIWWYGTVTKELGDGCVFVEFTSPQAAIIKLEANKLEAA